jgi:CDP-glucose 4,6-dehydratase
VDNRVDIRESIKLKEIILASKPDYIFHLAAQALVRLSYESPLETIATNALGTANLLDALRFLNKPIVAVIISSDKVYDNAEWVWGYRETDRLGGKDPYSASKGMAELATRSFVESFFNNPESKVKVGITRAGNVIGGGDWAVDRIVPDCIKAWSRGETVDIRNPEATRPWQHVLEPLSGYLTLGAELTTNPEMHGEAYNFGPPADQNHSVHDLINEMKKYWDSSRWSHISKNHEYIHEFGQLKLNCDKALFDLKWQPAMQFADTVRMTVEWYKKYYSSSGSSMFDFTVEQINEYTKLAKERGLRWAKYDR